MENTSPQVKPKRNLLFWLAIGLLTLALLVLGYLMIRSLRQNQITQVETQKAKAAADSLSGLLYQSNQRVASNQEDKTNQANAIRHEAKIQYIEVDRQTTAHRIESGDAAEKVRIFAELLDTPADSGEVSRDSTDL